MTQRIEHRYRPRGLVRAVFAAREDEVLVAGPAGTGKSRACLEKLHMIAMLNPNMRGIIIRKTAVSLGSTALVTFNKFVIAEALAAGDVEWYGGSRSESAGYRYTRNKSFIAVGGMDKPTRIMSSEYDFAYVQEATELTVTDWEAITTRLRNGRVSFQQLLADCNPDTPTHWLKRRCDSGDTRMIESRHEDNPVLFNEDGSLTTKGASYIRKLDRLTGVRKQRLRGGLWVAAEGIIYESYDPAIHLIDRFDIPQSWPRHWAVDFGFTNPFVLQCWAEDPDGRLYLYREIYHTKRMVAEHASAILAEVTDDTGRWTEPRPVSVVCDHDAEGRAQLERDLGLGTVAAHKAVSEGIQAVAARLTPADDGRPRLFILRDSVVTQDAGLEEDLLPTCTADEIPGYVWDQSPGKTPKETPLKVSDHGCDAMRYLVAEKDLSARPRVRWL